MGKLDNVLDKIKKAYKVDIPTAREAGKIERLTLDSPGMNYIFGGGMPLGRMIYLQGPESAGKTAISTYLASQVQKHYTGKKGVVILDFEYAFDSNHAEEMGLDIDNNFYIVRPLNAEDGFNMARDLIESGEIGMVILDSVTAMQSKAAVEDAFGGFAGGKTAAVIAFGIRMLLPYLYHNKCTLVIISQERASMDPMSYITYKGTGGRAPAFYSSWSARVTRAADITDSSKALEGLEIRVKNIKNKVGIAKRDAVLKLFFKGGIDSEEEYMDYVKALGMVEQKGAYYSNTTWVADDGTVGMKVCGMEKVKEYLKNNPKLYEQVKRDVNALITGYSILDTSSAELSEEEKMIENLGDEANTEGLE